MGKRSSMKRAARRGNDADAGAGKRPAKFTLMALAESIADDLAAKAKSDDLMDRNNKTTVVSSVASRIFYKGRRRIVALPSDLFKASRDLQVGCIYGALVRITKARVNTCMECGKVQRDLFAFDGKNLVKVPLRRSGRGGHGK